MKKILAFALTFGLFYCAPPENHTQSDAKGEQAAAKDTTPAYGSNQGHYLTINSTQIYYEEYGQGMPLLLLHSGLGSINDFRNIIPALAEKFRVIIADRPYHGRSWQADSLSYELMADYTSKMIDQLKLDSVYVLGWSDGGNTALVLAANRPDKVKKAIVCGSNYDTDGYTTEAAAFLPGFTQSFVETGMKEWLDDYKKKSPQKDEWKKFITDIKNMWLTKAVISEEKLRSIKAPVLVVFGDRDASTLEHGISMYRLIPGSQLCILPGTSHFVFAEKPSLITGLSLDFLTNAAQKKDSFSIVEQ